MIRQNWQRKSDTFTLQCQQHENDQQDLDVLLPVCMEDEHVQKVLIVSGRRHKVESDQKQAQCELSTDINSPGVLKIFGPALLPGVEYKSVLASYRSTASELVKQALERYGLPSSLYPDFVLCDVIGIPKDKSDESNANSILPNWRNLCCRDFGDSDRPLLLQKFWRPNEGACRRYEIRRKTEQCSLFSTDDTYGLNENARKISMSKLRPGAIPFFSPFSFGYSRHGEGVILSDFTLSTLTKKGKDNDRVINNLNLDITRDLGRPVSVMSVPSKAQFSNILGPATRPFFLTVRGYDVNNDLVYYTLDDKVTTLCNADTFPPTSSFIQLFAPDIQPQHCQLVIKRVPQTKEGHLHYNFCLEMECSVVANIKVNGYSVVGHITVNPGDLLSIGNHYIFLFKDMTAGSDVPHELAWLTSDDIGDSIIDRRQSDIRRQQNVVHVPPLVLDECQDDTESVCSLTSNATEIQREKFHFAYSLDKEDKLIREIGNMISRSDLTFPLSPGILYTMCIQYACMKHDRKHVRYLLLKILTVIREEVSGIANFLKSNKFSSGLLKMQQSSVSDDTSLRRLLLWMSNCVQMSIYLRQDHFRMYTTSQDLLRRTTEEKDVRAAVRELADGLQEVVSYCFQQAIYCITKTLYVLLPAILEDNPFPEESTAASHIPPATPTNMHKIIAILDALSKMMSVVHLHNDVKKQMHVYLFFFSSTTVFNRLFTKDAESLYYDWSSGVRMRANIGHIEDWANKNALEEEFGQQFEKLLKAAEFLSTSKSLLMKCDWMSLKRHFDPLNESQLYRLLSGYHADRKFIPPHTMPPPEERDCTNDEESLLIDLGRHPAFNLPHDNCSIDLLHLPDNKSFWAFFKALYSQFGVIEDENVQMESPRGLRNFTGNFPRMELQKSFYSNRESSEYKEDLHVSSNQYSKKKTCSNEQLSPRATNLPRKLKNNPKENDSARSESSTYESVPLRKGSIGRKSQLPQKVKSNVVSPQTRTVENPYKQNNEQQVSTVISRQDSVKSDNSRHSASRSIYSQDQEKRKYDLKQNKTIHAKDNEIKTIHSNSRVQSAPAIERNGSPVSRLVSLINHQSEKTCSLSEQKSGGTHLQYLKDKMQSAAPISKTTSHSPFHTSSITENGDLGQYGKELASPDRTCGNTTAGSSYHAHHKNHGITQQSEYEYLSSQEDRESSNANARSQIPRVRMTPPPSPRVDRPTPSNYFKRSASIVSNKSDASCHSSSSILRPPSVFSNGSEKCASVSRIPKCDNNTRAGQHRSRQCTLSGSMESGYSTERRYSHGPESDSDMRRRRSISLERATSRNDSTEEEFFTPVASKTSANQVITVKVTKGERGLGLGLIDGLYTPLRLAGIYVRKILPGSPAEKVESLEVGDRLLSVNGRSIVGADYQSTMKLIKASGTTIILVVAKGNTSIASKLTIAK